MNVWLCPKCGAPVFYGQMTVFGRYTKADAMLNHIEAKHPAWAEEVFG